MSQQSFHRIIFKNTGLFGFSQVLRIVMRIVTNKVAAVFIGTAGIGIIGLIENVLNLIRGISDLGVSSSSVREVAVISNNENEIVDEKELRLIQILYKWSWISGIIGVLVTLLFSKQICLSIFEKDEFRIEIIFLSLYFLFSSVASIRLSVLRGKKKVTTIVIHQLILVVLSTCISIPFYYLYGIKGIIPVFVATSFVDFLLSLFFTRNIKVSNSKLTFSEFTSELFPVFKLGMLLSINVVFGQICFYIIRWFLKENDSIDVLGIYQVGNTFLVSYLGLIFASMANDYYPRLCNYEKDEIKFNKLINDQTELALLLVVPSILALYLIAPYIIPILYTAEFISVLKILHIGLFSVILRAIVWPIGYISLVKNDKLMYFKQNVFGDFLNVILSVMLFHFFDLQGIGIALVVMFVFSGLYTFYGVNNKYNFKYRKDTKQVLLISIALGVLAILTVYFSDFSITNPYLIATMLISFIYSGINLKKKIYRNS